MEIKKGDIVGRISYGKDILFYVDRIIKLSNSDKSYAILKGVNYRIEADALLDDLEKIDKEQIDTETRGIENKIKKRINLVGKEIFTKEKTRYIGNKAASPLILHLDRRQEIYTKVRKIL